MKFNFDNLNNEESVPEAPQTPEITQEEFDAQIEQEAAKLKTSVEELAREIDAYGGPEEFKRKMEGHKYYWKRGLYQEKIAVLHQEGGNQQAKPEGQAIIDLHENKSETHLEKSKDLGKLSLFFSGLALMLEVLGDTMIDKIGLTGLGELMKKIELNEVQDADYVLPAIIGLLSTGTVGLMYKSLKENLASNKEKREVKKQELKHKMTEVEFNK
ncbi:MAG: hypothetical protein KBB86_03485 [Candidatus Pacebacteria bacterium]|nr:hypothetical protein [Candidatus Paceibacterota bacterium]